MAMKKLNYTLTVYKNTGFNGLDIPKSGSVLENASKQVYADVYYLREDLDLPQIQVNDNYHNLADVDYVKLTSNDVGSPNYYYFATPKAMAGNTTMLALELDALTTMGGAANLNYISGWQERGHIDKNDDVLFGNVAPEDWLPSQPLRSTNIEEVTEGVSGVTHPANDLQVIITNIDLIKLGKRNDNEIDVVKGGVLDPQGQMTNVDMYFPKIETSSNSTVFKMVTQPSSPSPVVSLSLPNTAAYDATNPVVKKGLEILFSAGQLQLQGSYTIPKEYVIDSINGAPCTMVSVDGLYTEIWGMYNLKEMSNFPFEYTEGSYTPKNKKVYTMFRLFTLANIASGASITKSANEMKYSNFNAPVVQQWADPTSTGKPSAKILTDEQAHITFADSVNGTNWINNQILMEGASGSLWNSINASFAQQNIDREIALSNLNNEYAVKQYFIQEEQLAVQQSKERMGNAIKTAAGAIAATAGIAAITAATGGTALIAGVGATAAGGGSLLAGANDLFNQTSLQDLQKLSLKYSGEQEIGNYMSNQERLQQATNENRVGLIKANGVVAPTTMFSPEPNLAMYGFNKFVMYETRLRLDDLKSLDNYFQRYGYNGIHRPLSAACFNCRQYYTFVQAFDINIKATAGYGMRIRNKAISQLNGGVRVWSVLPDAQYYESN